MEKNEQKRHNNVQESRQCLQMHALYTIVEETISPELHCPCKLAPQPDIILCPIITTAAVRMDYYSYI